MIVQSGSIALNGLDDTGMIKILEAKRSHEKLFQINPAGIQIAQTQPQPGQIIQKYNVTLNWNTEQGLKAAAELLHHLQSGEASERAA